MTQIELPAGLDASVDPSASDVELPSETEALRKGAMRGSAITLIGYGVSSLIRFGSNLLITRLLFPEQFGIMALVNVFVVGLQLFSDIGIGPNIIQSDRGDDPRFLNTAWTVQVSRGLILWIAACLVAWPLSRFYGRPQLTLLLPVTGFGALIGGLESTRLFTQNRRLALGRVTALEVITQVTGVVVMLTVAALTHSVWALVFSSLASAAVKTTLSHTLLPGERNRFAWDPAARKTLFEFGRWIFFSTALAFLSGQSDRLILGKLVSNATLGIYAIAVNLAALPATIIAQLSNRILYPITAAARRQGGKEWTSIRSNHSRLLLLLAPLVAMGVVLAPPAVSLLYRKPFWDVGPLAAALSIGTWLGAISTSYTIVLMAAGAPRFLTFGSITKTVLFAILVFPVSAHYGVSGVAILVSLSEIGFLIVAELGGRTVGVVAWKVDLALTAFSVAYFFLVKTLYALVFRFTHGARLPSILVVLSLTLALTGVLAKRSKLLGGSAARARP
jgi:O-antigen/teichoic acid export membrane protein